MRGMERRAPAIPSRLPPTMMAMMTARGFKPTAFSMTLGTRRWFSRS